MNNDKIVRKWLTACPGSFEGPDHTTALRAAYASAGVSGTMALSAFADALARMGYTPVCVRTEPMLCRLILPDAKSVGVRPRVYHD